MAMVDGFESLARVFMIGLLPFDDLLN